MAPTSVFTLLDRKTGQQISTAMARPSPIASVVKLFIADDLLLQVAQGQTQLTPDDRRALDVMLRSSDDNAAENRWNRYGGSAIITRVVNRYGLGSTSAPYDGHWWNTMSTTVDLVKYYHSMLLDGSRTAAAAGEHHGFPTSRSRPHRYRRLPAAVRHSGTDCSPNPVAGRGWMLLEWANWLHMSTGVVGPDRRYVMAIVLAATRRRRDCPSHDHRDTDDNVPRAAGSSRQSSRRADLDAGLESAPTTAAVAICAIWRGFPDRISGTARSAPVGRPCIAQAFQQPAVEIGIRIVLMRGQVAHHIGK